MLNLIFLKHQKADIHIWKGQVIQLLKKSRSPCFFGSVYGYHKIPTLAHIKDGHDAAFVSVNNGWEGYAMGVASSHNNHDPFDVIMAWFVEESAPLTMNIVPWFQRRKSAHVFYSLILPNNAEARRAPLLQITPLVRPLYTIEYHYARSSILPYENFMSSEQRLAIFKCSSIDPFAPYRNLEQLEKIAGVSYPTVFIEKR